MASDKQIIIDVLTTSVYSTHQWKSSKVIEILKSDGWELHNIRGSHYQFKHPIKTGKVTVPHPKKDLPIVTVKSIFGQAQIKR